MKPRNKHELEIMRRSGQITASALKKAVKAVKPGASLFEIEQVAEQEILHLGGQPSFKTVQGYKWATCLTVNHEVVHGIPRGIILQEGDVLGIDLGTVLKGWHTDAAWSVIVGNNQDKRDKIQFLKAGEEAMWAGIKQAVEGKRVGDISEAIQTIIEGRGFNVVRSLVGHGVGRKLHEEPEIPGFGKKGTGEPLRKGMTLAIEAIYIQGDKEVILEEDGWTISSKDGSLGGLFEMSIIVGKDKAEVLTDWRRV